MLTNLRHASVLSKGEGRDTPGKQDVSERQFWAFQGQSGQTLAELIRADHALLKSCFSQVHQEIQVGGRGATVRPAEWSGIQSQMVMSTPTNQRPVKRGKAAQGIYVLPESVVAFDFDVDGIDNWAPRFRDSLVSLVQSLTPRAASSRSRSCWTMSPGWPWARPSMAWLSCDPRDFKKPPAGQAAARWLALSALSHALRGGGRGGVA